MHIKRKTIGKFWPIPRTGSKYVAVPKHEDNKAVPLLVIMRDLLKLVKIKKELKKIVNEKKILVNGNIVKEINYPLMLYDSISIPGIKKHYKIVLNGKMLDAREVSENESNHKTYKVIGKKILSEKKIQINLSQGKNLLTNEKLETGNFVLINNKDKKISKIILIGKDIEVIVIAGKHLGRFGKIKEIITQGNEKIALINTNQGEIKANLKNVFIKE